MDKIASLNAVLQHLKQKFVGKDDVIDLMGICLAGRENLFLLGPPGTAKSAIVRELSRLLHGPSFEYLLTRFTEPNELFGPFDIRRLREGELVTNTAGMLPEASLIFLDELLNANSAILNSLLMVLNERVFRRGRENRALPALMIVGASNHLPEDAALQALFDRFLLRVHCDYVEGSRLNEVLQAGWELESGATGEAPVITAEDVLHIQQMLPQVDLSPVRDAYINLIVKMRNAGIPLSDRRAVKLQRLVAASALLCHRKAAQVSDLWVLRYAWDTDEQREILAGIVDQLIGKEKLGAEAHPRALSAGVPDAEALHAEVMRMDDLWANPETTGAERAVIRDRLRLLNGRCEWIRNPEQQAFVRQPIEALWQKILQTV
ncbi:AAA family ATPase [Chitinophaga caseinilytica]|uniref:AAA family ATPase n=1 Tax=Chitinophaga caseinilytica TaxID=2267521 RepID=A0ABZ2ZBF2_9BACT